MPMLQPLTQPSWLVFDLDNTLASTEAHGYPILLQNLQAELATLGHPIPTEPQGFLDYLHATYPRIGNILQAVKDKHAFDEQWVETLLARTSPQAVAAIAANLQADGTVNNQLQQLKNAGHHLHILTLSPSNYALPVLQHLGLLGTVFAPAHVHTSAYKRESKPYQSLLASFPNLHPLPRYMVEDSADNLSPARALGFTTIGIGEATFGHPAADYTFPTIQDFLTNLLPPAAQSVHPA